MKKILYIVVCMMLFCCVCSDADTAPNPVEQGKHQVALTFSPGEARTRIAVDETSIEDINIYLFPANGDPASVYRPAAFRDKSKFHRTSDNRLVEYKLQ